MRVTSRFPEAVRPPRYGSSFPEGLEEGLLINGTDGEKFVALPCEAEAAVLTRRGATDGLSPDDGSRLGLLTKGFFDEMTFPGRVVLIWPPVFDFLRLTEGRPL